GSNVRACPRFSLAGTSGTVSSSRRTAPSGCHRLSGEGGLSRVATGAKPAPLNATVSEQMSRIPRRSTGPELAVRRELHRRGLRFRVNYTALPGRPDLVFTRARLAVFVDGCFW